MVSPGKRRHSCCSLRTLGANTLGVCWPLGERRLLGRQRCGDRLPRRQGVACWPGVRAVEWATGWAV